MLRAWQKRYSAVTPGRSDAGQRLYSDADIERLRMMAEAVRRGHSVAQIAQYDAAALSQLLRQDQPQHDIREHIDVALAYTRTMDGDDLEAHLRRTLVALGVDTFFEEVLTPFLRRVGEAWARHEITPVHEHLAAATVRRVLEWVMTSCETSNDAPVILVTTPPGELHELGALFAATAAALEGWQVRYLGPNLPAADFARAATEARANAVAISAIAIDRAIANKFIGAVKQQIDPSIKVFAGGSALADGLSLRSFRSEIAVVASVVPRAR